MSQRSPSSRRTPGDVLREVRRKDSQVKRGKVLTTLEELKPCGEPITFRGVAAAAGVSISLVYSPGLREHIETAIAGQATAARRATATGTSA